MKYLRKFDSVSDMETALANATINILGLAYNGSTPAIRIKSGGTPGPDYSEPFYFEDVSGIANTVSIIKTASTAPTLAIEKSTDGVNWTSMGTTSTTAITSTIPANSKLYLRCNTTGWSTTSGSPIKHHYIYANRNCNIGGNIMSLIYGDNFTGDEIAFPAGSSHNFYGLFQSQTIISAANLLLPATTLTSNCYHSMFGSCTALTTAPVLPATTLAYRCYASIFSGCNNLNYIKCLATNISASGCLMNWVSGVAASGTFVKDPNMSSWPTGIAGIPEGWTVQDATA